MTAVASSGLGDRGRLRLGLIGIGLFLLALAATVVSPMVGAVLFLGTLVAGVVLRSQADPAAIVALYVVVLFLVPARFTLPLLGGLATPANTLAVACFALWVLIRVMPGGATRTSPGRVALLMLLWAAMLAMCVAFMRPLVPIEERAAVKGVIHLAGLSGVALLLGDGVRNRQRLDVVLRRLSVVAVITAVVGIFIFFTGIDLPGKMSIPGLVSESAPFPIEMRSKFRRVASTTEHPIEFGLILTMSLPLVVHRLRFGPERSRRRWAVAAVLVAVGIPMSVSRTVVLAMAIGAAVLIPSWPRAVKLQALKATIAFCIGMKLMVPGLLGTLRAIVLGASSDPSVTGRTMDYDYAGRYFFDSPLFGRGLNTFDPFLYDFLDNQFIKSAIEGGIILVGALVAVFAAGALGARRARRESTDEPTRDLCQALLASQLMAVGAFATFDLMSFDLAIGLLFVLVGLSMAIRRIVLDERRAALVAPAGAALPVEAWATAGPHATARGRSTTDAGSR